MNKLISKIVGVTLGLTLAAGVGVGAAVGSQNSARRVLADSTVDYTSIGSGERSTEVVGEETLDTNVWVLGGGITIIQHKASSNNAVANYTAANTIRMYVGHVFSIEAASGYGVVGVKVTNSTNKSYYGGNYTATTSWAGGNTAISSSDTTNLTLTNCSSTTSGQVSSIVAKSGSVSGIYFTTSKQSRPSAFTVSYTKPDASNPTGIACASQTITVTETVNLTNKTTVSPAGATTDLGFAIKSGSTCIDLDTTTGVVTGKKSGSAVVTITPSNTAGGATAIDVNITVNAIAAPGVSVGDSYAIYAVDSTNGNFELTGVASNLGTSTSFNGSVPSCSYVLEVEAGYFENTVAFKNGSSYLALTSDGNNLHTSSSVSKNSSWIVTYDSSDNSATIVNATYTSRSLQWNWNNGNGARFACYASVQTPILLYPYTDSALTDFTIDASISVYKTGTATIGVTYTPADASDKTLSWSSDDTSIATVDSNGVVTGVAVGTTTVTAYKVIDEVNVERTCAVTVLDNKATHAGSATDPFNVSDAYNVALGVITQTSTGAAIDLTNNYYYVKGIITKYNNRTTDNLTFWVGDNLSQISTATGGFEIFKVAQVYSTALATYYSSNTEVARDFAVGYTITASGKLTNYNGTLEMTTGGRVYYNSYIEARLFAEAFNTALEAVCDADGNTVAADLESAWSAQATAFAALDATLEQPILKNATAKTTSSATAVELCAAKYDYILGKYGTTTLSNFIDRTVSPSSANVRFAALANNNTALVVVAITAFVGVTFIGGYFFLRKKKEN